MTGRRPRSISPPSDTAAPRHRAAPPISAGDYDDTRFPTIAHGVALGAAASAVLWMAIVMTISRLL
ncbi:conserved hypothetical protein [Sphingomonas sp. T1]|uniref:hypothetical protein n=1 Tax=Sphingomonas sp. T1 TaxID=2653172 RepID=UPI0012F126DB|nr:hypothetical protein [Sphingomonas sp. T1]VXD07013.1 conserved hypothetical protein [Sphingomonas sp. T1]